MAKHYIGILLAALLANHAFADEAAIRKAAEATFPKIKVDNVTKTPYAGLYEVFLGGKILYTDDKFSFFIDGQLLDTKTKQNITESRFEELAKLDFSTLPLDKAIKTVKGNGSKKIAVFSDPDCPYCIRLEQQELSGITDITIYTFLYPLSMHPDAANKARAIWCAPDRAKAWQDWVLNNKLPKDAGKCETPIEAIAALGERGYITSTPTLILTDGKRINGAYPSKVIEAAIAAAAKKPATKTQ